MAEPPALPDRSRLYSEPLLVVRRKPEIVDGTPLYAILDQHGAALARWPASDSEPRAPHSARPVRGTYRKGTYRRPKPHGNDQNGAGDAARPARSAG
jgi:hypothetical protein